jgi:plasmid maintenance system antidote protein VapI
LLNPGDFLEGAAFHAHDENEHLETVPNPNIAPSRAPTPHSMTMHIGMPAEHISAFMRGWRSITPPMASVFEQCVGPAVHRLLPLQIIYDLEELVFCVNMCLAELPLLKMVKREHVSAARELRAGLRLALANVKPYLKILRKERPLIIRRLRAERRQWLRKRRRLFNRSRT